MLPVPTTAQLATSTGRTVDYYGPFAAEALAQATLLFALTTGLTELPTEPDKAKLANYAILQMADRIYLEQPNAEIIASPYQSETIGSYTYSKGSIVTKVKNGGTASETGLFWWDLAMDQLKVAGAADVFSGSLQVFDVRVVQLDDGAVHLLTPADVEQEPTYYRIS